MPVKRRAFDSVDPEFDDDVPDVPKDKSANFFSEFSPAFERNSRWSNRKHVPKLGDPNTPRDKVDK